MSWMEPYIGMAAPIVVRDGPHRLLSTSVLPSGAFNVGTVICGEWPLNAPATPPAIAPLPVSPERRSDPKPAAGTPAGRT